MDKKYFFKIEIEGVDGHLTYSVFSKSEQEAHDTVSFFLRSNPFIISKLEKKIITVKKLWMI